MALFTIDEEKCDQDGLCAIECPAHLIKMTDKGPVPVPDADQICIHCGHCVAICPHSALTLAFLSADQCMPIEPDLFLDAHKAEHFLRSRRAVRHYKKKSVPRAVLEKALTIACCAPTGSNKQPVKWLVVDKKAEVVKIGGHVIDWMRYVQKTHPQVARTMNMDALIDQWDQGIDRICRNAPLLVFAYASDEFGSAAADCHTALAYLELVLPSLGLGSCWAGYVNYAAGQWPGLAQKLALPDHHACHGALMVGFPKFKYARAPRRNPPDIVYHV